jgi:putative inorganic carbon (hco3(-)) transporter
MRDIVFSALVLGALPFILRRPQLGVMMYVWISVMSPHRYTWSFAHDFNWAMIVAVVTLVGALFSKDLKRPPMSALIVALALFAVWTTVTTIFAIDPSSAERWKALMKHMLIAFLIPMLFHKKEDIHLLIWVIAGSIAFYGTKGGIFTLATAGQGRVFGPVGSYIEDNNAIAAGIIMIVPLLRYLHLTTAQLYLRWALVLVMIISGVAVLGTYSRGAFLAVFVMIAVLWWKGRNKLPVLLVILAAVPFALSLMPEKWYERIETIKTYQEQGSAQMRFNSWGTAVNIANARLTGAGFEIATRPIYDRYAPDPSFPPQTAHSIYFEVLGGHGYVGLALYLFVLSAFWFTANSIARAAKRRAEDAWAGHLALMMQVSLVGFGVGGAFLTLATFDVPYYLMGALAATAAVIARKRPDNEVAKADDWARRNRAVPIANPISR